MEEANYLTKFASKVHLLHRREAFRASKIMIDRTYAHPKIDVHTEHRGGRGPGRREGRGAQDPGHGHGRRAGAPDGGPVHRHRPQAEHRTCSRDWLDVDEKGYLVAHDHTRSRIDGVFIAGDVHDHRYRQAVTAAGDGCKAAIDAERWLEHEGLAEHQTATAW